MNTIYYPSLKGNVSLDDYNKIRYINHNQEYWLGENEDPKLVAAEYLHQVAPTFEFPVEQLRNIHQKVSYFDPREQGVEYRLSDEKRFFDSTTYDYYQTYLNVPVWRAGIAVTVKENPARVVYAANTSQENFYAQLPDQAVIERYRQLFRQGSVYQIRYEDELRVSASENETNETEEFGNEETASFIHDILGIHIGKKAAEKDINTRAGLIRGRFFMYKYEAAKRLPQQDHDSVDNPRNQSVNLESHSHPHIDLPPVSERIREGQYYLVAEITFSYNTPQFGHVIWLALVEVETNSILYIEPQTLGVNGLVFTQDPITSTGTLTNTAAQSNAVLNPLRDDVTLTHLDAPVGGVQNLRGTFVQISNVEDPNIAAPTNPTGTDFDYNTRTNNFAAVSAYYHETELFKTIESLGFPIATYFDGTTFPIPVDHRGLGTEVNAHWSPNGVGGTGHMCYGLGDDADTANPIGRAVDKWVHWHEMGGHGTLGDHVGGGTFGFAHSPGDGLAAIQNDPDSLLRALPERFRYAPFRAGLDRWFNRDVAAGWGWGGTRDTGGYNSEQILATCNFRIYRSIGGDAANLGRRRHASRVTTYLILRAISTLTPATNPSNALGFCNALMAVDLLNWTSEGLFGGAYNKLIRWAFERQGLFQPAGASTPVTAAGAPPQFDVYINDGRNGEYQYKHDHWNNTSVWNRNSADGGTSHQSAIEGTTNYAYVKIRNRGTSAASNVVVKGYHCLPGAGLTWPTDFTQMTPLDGHSVASIGPNNSEEVTLGPFAWVPNANVYGHDCLLMIASATGDPSNIQNFTAGETIAEWRLVPHDNNVGQRNVTLVPGGGGMEGLLSGLHEHVFYAGNTFRRKATMELKATLPEVLAKNGWRIQFKDITGNKFELQPGEKRRIVIDLVPGAQFTKDQIHDTLDRDIAVLLYANDMLMGGMTYRLDPEMKEPVNQPDNGKSKCIDKANDLVKCLNLGDNKVKKVCVTKISLDIEMDNDCKCD